MNTSIASPSSLVDLYLRLSNADDGADSLERQETDLRAWASREGLIVRKVWSDYGRSGYKKEVRRSGFDAAVRAVTGGEVGTLAVWKLDRLSRRGAGQIGLLLEDVEDAGGRLYFLRDGLDSAVGNLRIVIVTISELARAESANTSLRVRSRKSADRAAGRYLGGAAPFGYVVDQDRRLRPHETEFDLMRELVRRVTEGDSLLTVARDWNRREIPTRRGGLWRSSTLSHALRSPALAGLMTETSGPGKVAYTYRRPDTGEPVSLMADGFEAIASESEQVRLLQVMDGRLRAYGRGMRVVKQARSLLGVLAKCASCQRTLSTFGESYRCKRSFADGSDCPAPVTVSTSVLDDAVRRAWSRRLAALEPDSPVLDRIGDRWLQKFDPAPLRERDEVRQLLAEAETRLAKADADYYEHGTLDEERHARVTEGLTRRLRALCERLDALPPPEADLGALLDPELSLPAIESASVQEARDLLRIAIERVLVTPAPRRGARFLAHERLSFEWVGDA